MTKTSKQPKPKPSKRPGGTIEKLGPAKRLRPAKR